MVSSFVFVINPADLMTLDPVDVLQYPALDDQMNLAVLFKRGQVLVNLLDLFDRQFCQSNSIQEREELRIVRSSHPSFPAPCSITKRINNSIITI